MKMYFTASYRRIAAKTAQLGAVAALSAATIALPMSAQAQDLQPVTIRIAADFSPPPHPAAIALEFFKERLPEVIPGSSLRIYHAGALYTIPEAVEAMTDGNLEMAWGQFGKTAPIEPYMSVVTGPMLLTTPGAMNQLDNFETYKFLAERMEQAHGVKLLATGQLSMFIGIGAGERITKPDDFGGKKIRSMGPSENAALDRWGASPVTMAFGDVPPALQTKVIDGLLTSLGGFINVKEQAPYFTVAGINGVVGDYYWIGASQIWWDSLNADTQNALQKLVVDEVMPFQKKANWCNDKRVLDQYGTDDPGKPGIFILSADQQKVFADKLGDATLTWVKENTPDEANEWADKFVAEAKAASEANPMGSTDLEKTDCSELAPWFERFTKK
jgi:TRAP-type C4-dicarboxylate transport system substrate-binding protein